MRVLIVTHSDVHGGAAKSALRLHRALLDNRMDSKMIVARRTLKDDTIIGPQSNFRNTLSDLRVYATYPLHLLHTPQNRSLHSYNILPSGLHLKINRMNIDVVNLHWINREMISIAEISQIRHPIVWTLHDMWVFSGAAHYDDLSFPNRFMKEKKLFPRRYRLDLDQWVFKRKQKHFKNKTIYFVTPSQWLMQKVKKSRLFGHHPVTTIPYCIDTTVFKPIDKRLAKKILNLDGSKQHLLFGSISGTNDLRKGFPYLKKALKILSESIKRKDIECLIVGGSTGRKTTDFDFPVHFLGHFADELSMAMVLSAADLFVLPSLQDNLPNMIMEAMSCGTPCVGFNTGGIPDMIDHKINGYIARFKDVKDLADGINWVVNATIPEDLRQNARTKVLRSYNHVTITKQYKRVFKQAVLKKNHHIH